MKHIKIIFLLSLLLSILSTSAQNKPSQRWLDQKFSMFIHFGIYSELGGVWKGEPVKWGYSEQIQSFAGIFSDWYANTANDFNPENWNAEQVVALAKEAGMRSIVFTSKHHDGFCMYQSNYTNFNIVDASPYGRDLMKELSEACKKGGIDFSVYFSLIDWHFPEAYPISSHNADPLTAAHYEYNLKQVEEIMTKYGEISEIWFDMGSLLPEQSRGLYELVNRLQPNCMISGRLGNDYSDFCVMADNEYPDYKISLPWQTAASLFNETWSYRSWQERGDVDTKVNEKILSLLKVVSRGGNYLLNIGPKGDGSVVDFERDVLIKIGAWLKQNGEAIYASKKNPFDQNFSWGEITEKEDALYLFIHQRPESGKIQLPNLQGKIASIEELDNKQEFSFMHPDGEKGSTLTIELPNNQKIASPYTVLKIKFNGKHKVLPTNTISGNLLNQSNAIKNFGHSSLDYYCGYKSLIAYQWNFADKRKKITPEITYTENEKGKTIRLSVNSKSQEILLSNDKAFVKKRDKNAIKWGKTYRKRGRGVFGFVAEEHQAIINGMKDKEWTVIEHFVQGKTYKENLRERGSFLLLQEIEAKRDCDIALEIGGGNGSYILLNGEYITANCSRSSTKEQITLLVLPLKKGKNQIIVKHFNRYEKELCYSLKALDEWTIYKKRLSNFPLKGENPHNMLLELANPSSKVSPICLSNIRIEL